MRTFGDLKATIPIYVTRKTATGETGSLDLSIWMCLIALLLVWFNLVVWSLIGLYEAIRVVIG